MSDLSILKKARMEGVDLSLNPDGTIRAVGAADVLANLRRALLENKQCIVEYLKLHANLVQFRLDLLEEAIAAGHPAQELHRVNNMAWEFVRADGMSFDEAIRVAAAIVATCPPAPCEASYVDVWTLWIESARN